MATVCHFWTSPQSLSPLEQDEACARAVTCQILANGVAVVEQGCIFVPAGQRPLIVLNRNRLERSMNEISSSRPGTLDLAILWIAVLDVLQGSFHALSGSRFHSDRLVDSATLSCR